MPDGEDPKPSVITFGPGASVALPVEVEGRVVKARIQQTVDGKMEIRFSEPVDLGKLWA